MGKGWAMKDYSTDGRKRILVVENESEISPFISKVLTSKAVEVDVAGDGDIAEKMLQGKDYILCIIDLGTLMAKDKQLYQYMSEKYPKLLNGAIFTAGGVVAGDAKVFMEHPIKLFLHKPFAPEWLKEIVSKTLAQVDR
jgi:DNA-binding NtrC family response regulator